LDFYKKLRNKTHDTAHRNNDIHTLTFSTTLTAFRMMRMIPGRMASTDNCKRIHTSSDGQYGQLQENSYIQWWPVRTATEEFIHPVMASTDSYKRIHTSSDGQYGQLQKNSYIKWWPVRTATEEFIHPVIASTDSYKIIHTSSDGQYGQLQDNSYIQWWP